MTIGWKISLGFLAVCSLIGIVGLLGIILSGQVRGLRTVELPMEQNLREVEVSIWEAIHAADNFRLTGLPYYEELYHKQIDDVNEFLPGYEALADTDEEKAYIREFNVLWNEAKAAGGRMVELTKSQEEQEKLFYEGVDGADEVIDSDIQAKWSSDDPHRLAKEQAVREVEVSIWEAIHAAHQYVGLSGEVREFKDLYAGGLKEADFQKLVIKQFGDVDEFWSKYKALATVRWEKEAIAKFEGFWKQAVRAGNKMLLFHKEAGEQFKILYEKVDKADDVIDYKMQAYIQKRIEKEDLLARRIRNMAIAVIILSISFAIVISVFISSSIAIPIAKLRDAADEIGKGRLGAIVEVKSRDEIGELAKSFNSMAELRKKAEEELRASEERFRTVAEYAGDAIIGLKSLGIVCLWNKKAEQIFGYTMDEAMGKSMHELITPERYRERALNGLRTFFHTGLGPLIGKTLEIEALRRSGEEFPVELSISTVNIEGEWRAIGIVRDITERKKIEEELKKANEELLEKAQYLERFNRLMVGREYKMIKLKAEVNELLEKGGQAKKYETPDEVKEWSRT